MFAGVAAGISRRTGIDVTYVRIAFVLLSLVSGIGLAVYVISWLLLPLDGEDSSIIARAVSDRRGLVLAVALVPAFAVALLVASVLHVAYVDTFAWAVFLSAAGIVLVWRDASPEEVAWLREAADPVVHMGQRSRRIFLARVAVGLLLVLGGVALIVLAGSSAPVLRHGQAVPAHSGSGLVGPVTGVLLVLAGIVVLFGPWWLRLGRDLVAERQARIRAEDRADMAARVHDSVLQTLALIQRSADQPGKVVQLARAQERELRQWLFEGKAPGAIAEGATTLAEGVGLIAREMEEAHGVSVEVVTVGNCPLNDDLRAMLEAGREATVNAAKWSGAPVISLFAEAEPRRVSLFVRDRGKGFDPDLVAEDRKGIAESIRARMARHGGSAVLRSVAGEGTEVELSMPRPSEMT